MQVRFLGVGESFDEDYANNSHLIVSQTRLLLDCGYGVPTLLWSWHPEPDFLDAIYISHAHADHCFGLPLLLLKYCTARRSKPLVLISCAGMQRRIVELMEFAYRGVYAKLPFPLEFLAVTEGQGVEFREFSMDFAATLHPEPNLAVRIRHGGTAVCYSGDGQFTDASERLYSGASLLIHEAHTLEPGYPGHSGLREVVAMARHAGVHTLALTHLSRDLRRDPDKCLSLEFRVPGIPAS